VHLLVYSWIVVIGELLCISLLFGIQTHIPKLSCLPGLVSAVSHFLWEIDLCSNSTTSFRLRSCKMYLLSRSRTGHTLKMVLSYCAVLFSVFIMCLCHVVFRLLVLKKWGAQWTRTDVRSSVAQRHMWCRWSATLGRLHAWLDAVEKTNRRSHYELAHTKSIFLDVI
jgi:hypothetical protein